MDGRIVILGAGHAGGSVAALLRQQGWRGPITLVGEEPVAPYQRPPLSKAWLKGEADAASLALRPHSFYAEHDLHLRLGVRAEAIVRREGGGDVALSSGETLAYDKLVLATGSRARRIPLPGLELEGVLELRTAADADQLKAALRPGVRLAIIGGGYIGLEAAASARALGVEATGIELQPRVLGRVARLLVRVPQAVRARLYAIVSQNRRALAVGAPIRSTSSLDSLGPRDPLVAAINDVPLRSGVRLHSLLGNRGRRGPVERSSDGVVAYGSAHLPQAESERVVPAGHTGTLKSPQTADELARILAGANR